MIEDEKRLFYAQVSVPIGEDKRTLIPCMAYDEDGARMIFESWRRKAIRKYGDFLIIAIFPNGSLKLRALRLGFEIRKRKARKINRFLARNFRGPQNKIFHDRLRRFLKDRIALN